MKTSTKLLIPVVITGILSIVTGQDLFYYVGLGFGYAFFYYNGKETARKEVAKGLLILASNLKCDYCGQSPSLIEIRAANKWACDGCYRERETKYEN
jgi:hypothetical protein